MITRIKSFLLRGIEAVSVIVECEVTPGIGIHMVGIDDASVRESLLRTITAMQSWGYRIPGKKIIINIKGAEGACLRGQNALDLPVALAVITASGQLRNAPRNDDGNVDFKYIVAGELALDGHVRDIAGGVAASALTLDAMILPEASAARAKDPATGLPFPVVYKAATLGDAVRILEGGGEDLFVSISTAAETPKEDIPVFLSDTEIRACAIAAAGGFDLAVVGPEGTSLSGPARLLSRLLDPHADGKAAIYDAALGRKAPMEAPLRIPHPASSAATLFGGGSRVAPGEVTLAHGGVLCLEDIGLWPKTSVETLGAIHEDGEVKISRLGSVITMPADFRLTVTMTDSTPVDAKVSRLLGVFPFVQVYHNGLAVREIRTEEIAELRRRVQHAKEHLGSAPAAMKAKDIPAPDPEHNEADRLAERLVGVFGMGVRDWDTIRRLAMTIAALDGKDCAYDTASVCEAASYIFLNRRAA